MATEISIERLLGESRWLARAARHLVGEDEADDLVQDAYLAALQGPAPVRGARGWLATVMRRRAGRTAGRDRSRRDGEQIAAAEAPAGAPAAQDVVEHLDLARTLAEELGQLPEDERVALYMRYYEAKDASSIGAQLGVPPSTVRWRLARGRDHLRRRLVARDIAGEPSDWNGWRAALTPLGAVGARGFDTGTHIGGWIMGVKSGLVGAAGGALLATGVWFAEGAPAGPPAPEQSARSAEPRDVPEPELDPSLAVHSNRVVPRSAVNGSARQALLLGRLVDPDGAPIPEGTVGITGGDGLPAGSATVANGSWAAAEVAPGRVTLRVSAPDFVDATGELDLPPSGVVRRDMVLERALTIPVRFEDPEGEPLEPIRTSFGAGNPWPFLGVHLSADRPGEEVRLRGRRVDWSEGGRFEPRDEARGSWAPGSEFQGRIVTSIPAPLWASLTYRDRVLETRSIDSGTESLLFQVNMDAIAATHGSVRVRIVDDASGAPLLDGFRIEHPSGGPAITPRRDGDVLIFEDVPPGPMELTTGRGVDGRERLELGVDLDAGEDLDLGTVRLRPAAPFDVIVLGPDRRPVSARVRAVRLGLPRAPGDLDLRVSASTGAGGRATVSWTGAGEVLVRAGGHDGFALASALVDPRTSSEVTIALEPARSVRFVDIARKGAVAYEIIKADGVLLQRWMSPPASAPLAVGSYRLVVQGDAGTLLSRAFAVDGDKTVVRGSK